MIGKRLDNTATRMYITSSSITIYSLLYLDDNLNN